MYYIIFDLEATCWNTGDNHQSTHEIIEIGAVKLDNQCEILSKFQHFVRPTLNPILSDFCTKLTSITQNDVSNALTLDVVIRLFENWILQGSEAVTMISWGQYDKNQILKECISKNIHTKMELTLEKHINLKQEFARHRKMKQCGMKKALDILDIPLEGSHHRGIDDARNIAKIFCKSKSSWFQITNT